MNTCTDLATICGNCDGSGECFEEDEYGLDCYLCPICKGTGERQKDLAGNIIGP